MLAKRMSGAKRASFTCALFGIAALQMFLSPMQARAVDLRAEDLPKTPVIARSGFVSSALSNPVALSDTLYKQNDVEFQLADGSRVGGFLFAKQNPNPVPLIIVNLGALADRWFNTSRGLVKKILLAGKLDAHVLIVDSVSSAGFYALNHSISLGGYDEGRVLLEIGKQVRAHAPVKISSVHLMGVSLGGLATLQAMIEDGRLHSHVFDSAVTFSGVVNQERDTQVVLNTFGYRMQGASDAKLPTSGELLLYSTVPHFNSVLSDFGVTHFKLSYTDTGADVYRAFSNRLSYLRSRAGFEKNWRGDVNADSVESYISTSSRVMKEADRVESPIYMIHAEDDPVVPYSEFVSFADAHARNLLIRTIRVEQGGHYGFQAAYGVDWMVRILNAMLNAR